MKKTLKTTNRKKSVFIIAEAGSNWNVGTSKRNQKMALELIDAAAIAGADAVKFQTFQADTVYVPNAGTSDYLSDNGICESINDIFKKLAMPYDMIPKLFNHCKKRKIQFMSSVFSKQDLSSVNPFVKRHKIASYEITHARLIEWVAKTRKPLILSTGASTHEEIEWAIKHFRRCGGKQISLMQCTAKYPAPPKDMNLRTLIELKKKYQLPVGLSDHSRDPIMAPVAAVALGAELIEKHFTMDNNAEGPDHAFAITSEELKYMVRAIRDCEIALGTGIKRVLSCERELQSYAKRGIQAITDIKKGDILIEDKNIAILRPGKRRQGMHPKWIKEVSGKRASKLVNIGDGIRSGDYIEAK